MGWDVPLIQLEKNQVNSTLWKNCMAGVSRGYRAQHLSQQWAKLCPEVMWGPRKIWLMEKWIPAKEKQCWCSSCKGLIRMRKVLAVRLTCVAQELSLTSSGAPASGSDGDGVGWHCWGRVSALLTDQSPWLSFLCSAQNHSLLFDVCVQGISCKPTGIWFSSRTFILP